MDPVDLRGEDEVVLAEAVDGVGVDGDLGPAPRDAEVRVVALLLGDAADPVREVQGSDEVVESELPGDVVLIDGLPPLVDPVQVRLQLLQKRVASPSLLVVLRGYGNTRSSRKRPQNRFLTKPMSSGSGPIMASMFWIMARSSSETPLMSLSPLVGLAMAGRGVVRRSSAGPPPRRNDRLGTTAGVGSASKQRMVVRIPPDGGSCDGSNPAAFRGLLSCPPLVSAVARGRPQRYVENLFGETFAACDFVDLVP